MIHLNNKGENLLRLQEKVNFCLIPDTVLIRCSDYLKDKVKVFESLSISLNTELRLIVRSSASTEDSSNNSMAGQFHSELDVKFKLGHFCEAVEAVLASYSERSLELDQEIFMVQNMVENVTCSGVVFTKDPIANAPYHIINYDDESGKTDTVTSGNGKGKSKVLRIVNGYESKLKSTRFKSLLTAVLEIEALCNLNTLDIEFAIDDMNRPWILQVRPLIIKAKENFDLKFISKAQLKYQNLLEKSNTKSTVFGQMPDWNPAEIIGQVPVRFSYSLYSELITDESWLRGRARLNYSLLDETKLMYSFCGHPFIDVEKSCRSFIPQHVPEQLAKKLVMQSLQKIKEYPELHDKIEFEVIPTCFDFELNDKLSSGFYGNFSEQEIQILMEAYKNQLSDIILDWKNLKKEFESSKIELDCLLKDIDGIEKLDGVTLQNVISKLKKHGTEPFSTAARLGFIGSILFDSLVKKFGFSESDRVNFLSSIETITSQYIDDVEKYEQSKLSLKELVAEYGHLRPSTYEIASKCYAEQAELVFKKTSNNKPKDKLSGKNLDKKIIKVSNDLNIFMPELSITQFIKETIALRESTKFEFTKVLSKIIQKIMKVSTMPVPEN